MKIITSFHVRVGLVEAVLCVADLQAALFYPDPSHNVWTTAPCTAPQIFNCEEMPT